MKQIDWVEELEKDEEKTQDLIDWLEDDKPKSHLYNRLFRWKDLEEDVEKIKNSSLFRRMLRDLSME